MWRRYLLLNRRPNWQKSRCVWLEQRSEACQRSGLVLVRVRSEYTIDCSALHRASHFIFLFHKREQLEWNTGVERPPRRRSCRANNEDVPEKIVERCRCTRATSTIYCGCSAINRT